jgi:hypothetical protein
MPDLASLVDAAWIQKTLLYWNLIVPTAVRFLSIRSATSMSWKIWEPSPLLQNGHV